jgi:hypothetical protein
MLLHNWDFKRNNRRITIRYSKDKITQYIACLVQYEKNIKAFWYRDCVPK